MTLILQVFYSIFSGVMLSAAIPNEIYKFGEPVLTFFALIPFYITIRYLCKNYRQAFWCTFIQVITTHLISSFWLAYFKDFAIFTLGASALGTALIGACMGILFYLPYSRNTGLKTCNKKWDNRTYCELNNFSLQKPFYEHTSFRVFYFAVVYTFWEWVKSSGFLGYPWGTISSAMYRFNTFTQIAAITGTYGITFLTILFNAILAEGAILFMQSQKIQGCDIQIKRDFFFELKNSAAVFVILFALSLFYGSYQISLKRTPIKTLTTIMVQQNQNPWSTNNDDETILKSEELTQKQIDILEKEDKKPQLIVWSEGSLLKAMPDGYGHYKKNPKEKSLVSFIKECGAPLLTGGPLFVWNDDGESGKYYNGAHIFDEEGNYRGAYAKLHLVPFAESIPGIDNPKIKALMLKVVGISAGWHKGRKLTYFDIPCSYYDGYDKSDKPFESAIETINIQMSQSQQKELAKEGPTVRICTPICFDDSFTDVIRPLFLNGAELFINITDDSWSLKDSSEIQHFVVASYRTIEYRTTMIRSANAGYSVVINPTGKIIADEPLFTDYSLNFDVPIYQRVLTTYAVFGNWLPYLCIIISFFTAVFMCKSFVKSDYIPSERKIKNKKHKKHSKKK